MAGSEYGEERKEEIELAAAEQEEAFAQRQADYEAACEAREAEGQAKLIQSGLAIVIGTIAIVKYIFTYGHQSAKNWTMVFKLIGMALFDGNVYL